MYSLLNENPLALYDGDQGNVLLVDGYVSQWTDRSNNLDPNRNAVQATAANRPFYTVSDSDFNGYGSLNFNGAGTISLATTTFSIPATQPLTYYIVGKSNGIGGQQVLDGISIRNRIYVSNNQINIWSGATLSATGSANLNYILGATFDNTNSAIYLNSTMASSSGAVGSTTGVTGLLIGLTYLGKIACIAVFQGNHNLETRTRIMKYLSNKYGIAIDQPLAKYNLDAGGYTVSSGTSVNALLDQSVRKDTNRNAIQATVGNQPTLTAVDSALNNQGTITFPGANSVLETTAIVIAQPSTYYVVCQNPAASATDIFMVDDYTNGSRNAIGMTSNGYSTIAAATSVSGTTNYKNTKIVYCIVFNNTLSAIYNNNSFVAEVSGTAGVQNVARLILGNDFDHSNPYTGKFAHLETYSGSHDADTRTSIMESLGAKYGIAVNKPLAVYDGDLGITLNAGNVSSWADQSGQGDSTRGLIQNTALSQPVYTANNAEFNGHGTVTPTNLKYVASGVVAFAQPAVWYIVTKLPATGVFKSLLNRADGAFEYGIYRESTGQMSLYAGSWLYSASIPPTTSHVVICAVFNGASSALYVNSITATTNAGAAGANSKTNISFGGTSGNWGEPIAYAACYSGVHTTAQRTKIMKQLGVKYNIRILARPVLEFDADLGITLNVDKVSAWNDQSETNDTNKNAVQATGINQPLYTLYDADFNNHASITFGGATFLKSLTFAAALTQPTMIYIVYKPGAGAAIETVIDGLDGTHRNAISTTANGYATINAGTALSGAVNYKNTRLIHCAYFNGTTSVQYINNSKMLESSGNANTNSLTGITIGQDYAGTTELQGKIAYIGIYSGYHNNEIRKMLQNVLSVKYGIEIVQG